MRMDLNRVRNQPSAAEILSHIDEDSLSRILKVSFAWSEQKNYYYDFGSSRRCTAKRSRLKKLPEQ